MANKQFAVLDSDSHVVETPELWSKYLEPEYPHAGKLRSGAKKASSAAT